MGFFDIFVYAPFVVFALVVPAFVMRCWFSPVTKAVWAAVLFLSLLKFWFFRTFGGHPFNPEFHEAVIIAWDVAHTGAVILCALSVVFFWRFRGRGTVLPVVALLTALAGVICGVVVPGVKEVRLEYPGLPDSLDGFRIVHVTDLHCSSSARRSRTEAVVAKVNALKADVICLTGDYVDGYAADRGMDLEPIKDLKAKRGVFFVTGNHEYYRIGDGILYVSPGAGQWAGFLCRFFNPSEITLLELRGKKGMDANGG